MLSQKRVFLFFFFLYVWISGYVHTQNYYGDKIPLYPNIPHILSDICFLFLAHTQRFDDSCNF